MQKSFFASPYNFVGLSSQPFIFNYIMKKSFKISEKIRETVHILSGIVAVISLVATILLSPMGKSLLKTDNSTHQPEQTTSVAPNSTYKSRKNYTFFLDKRVFSRSINEDTTTIRAIKNNSVKMTITPLHGTSYTRLCESTKQYAREIFEYTEPNISTLYSVYSVTENGNITTVYCIDDGLGSSLEIKYTMPENDDEIKESFDILLSMFKLL